MAGENGDSVEERLAGSSSSSLRVHSAHLARCAECLAYINGYCAFERSGWICALCGAMTGYQDSRYTRAATRANLNELQFEVYEADVDLEPGEDDDYDDNNIRTRSPANVASTSIAEGHPAYIALVDVSSTPEFLEVVKSALLAALEALDESAAFGLITFDRACVGIHDLGGEEMMASRDHDASQFTPSVRVVPLSTEPADTISAVGMSMSVPPSSVPLTDVVPLESMLASVGMHKERIIGAVEALSPSKSHQPGARRAFGAAMEATCDLWACTPPCPKTAFGCRVSAFLSGAPDSGRGALVTDAGEKHNGGASNGTVRERSANAAHWLTAPPDGFYARIGAACTRVGLAVDVHCIVPASRLPVGIAELDIMSRATGGHVRLYTPDGDDDTSNVALPRDLYRHLAAPVAFDGTLRVRTSPEFRVSRGYGASLAEDAAYEGVYHMPRCAVSDTVCFDFEYADRLGFARDAGCPPMVQVAFQYSIAVPLRALSSSGLKVARLERRLRVRTVQASSSPNVDEVFDSVNAPVVASLLHHKICRAVADEGIEEGRALLKDWLVILTANYHGTRTLKQDAPLDVSMASCEALSSLPRLAYAMLWGALLRRPDDDTVHPDSRAAELALLNRLPPALVSRLIYPVLSSYTAQGDLAFPRHSLSESALSAAYEGDGGDDSPAIFVLDAVLEVVVAYTPAAASYPCPPPAGSAIRKILDRWRMERPVAPRVVYASANDEAGWQRFRSYLVEERGEGGFVGFLDGLAGDVKTFLETS